MIEGPPTAVRQAASSAAVLEGWRQPLVTRLLGLQLLFAMPLLLWGLPQIVASRAWVLLGNIALQLVLQATVTAWRTGPMAIRGSVASLAFVFSGAGIILGGGDAATGALLMLTALVLAVVLLGIRGALLVLTLEAVVLALHAWSLSTGGPLLEQSVVRLPEGQQRLALLAVFLTGGATVVASVGFLVARLRQSIDDVLQANERLTRESLEKAEALERLQLTQERVIEAGKMELLGRLAGGIAHDMNNALTVVLAEASLLADTNPEASTSISEAAEHAAKLTQQLLAMGRRDAVQPRPCEASGVIEKAVRLARRTLPGDISVETALQADGAFIRADPNQIQQIVLNLTTNGRDAMPAGGRLTVALSATDSTVVLEVRDSGSGMDEATRQRIFDPFFTTKALGMGTGLGLASVRDVVTRLGGSITCESSPGAGTCFTVVLPRLPPGEVPAETAVPEPASNGLRGRRILVAEDDIRVRAVVVGALKGAGAEVIDADNSAHAITLAEGEAQRFDLVWTDVVMPEGGAAPLLAWLAANRPSTPIIICSGYADDELIRREVALGRYRLLSKPFSPAQAVAACLAELGSAPGR